MEWFEPEEVVRLSEVLVFLVDVTVAGFPVSRIMPFPACWLGKKTDDVVFVVVAFLTYNSRIHEMADVLLGALLEMGSAGVLGPGFPVA